MLMSAALAACASLPSVRHDTNWAASGERVGGQRTPRASWRSATQPAGQISGLGSPTNSHGRRVTMESLSLPGARSDWQLDNPHSYRQWAPIVSSHLNPVAPPENRTRAAPRLGLMEDDQAVSLAIGAYWALPTPPRSTSRTGYGPSSPALAGRWRGPPLSCRGSCVSQVLLKTTSGAAPLTSPTSRRHIGRQAPPITPIGMRSMAKGRSIPAT